MNRRYTASDVRRYARCPRQWWYEARREDLAALDADEVRRRLAALRRRYGARAPEQPAYQLLTDLSARHERLRRGRRAHQAHASRVARRRLGCLLPAALVAAALGVVCGVGFATCRPWLWYLSIKGCYRYCSRHVIPIQ